MGIAAPTEVRHLCGLSSESKQEYHIVGALNPLGTKWSLVIGGYTLEDILACPVCGEKLPEMVGLLVVYGTQTT